MSKEETQTNMRDKVTQYETFLNEKLRKDLSKILEQRDEVYKQTAEYLQLKTVIETIKQTDYTKEELKTKIDLGCNFYVQAKVPDTSMIFVNIGFGFYVELTHDEALKFITKKTDNLDEKAKILTKDATSVKAHIKLVLEGLRELQQIPREPEKKPYRDVLS
ncbi:Protein UXT homolog,Protein UXT [Mytilus edulis]|uniref:Protein UXT homolog,Protein UXT n=1 Tax=Mytilus edulis TaxID=6550 RepID=A0A8S3RZ15_MYTED|nr:Protein UXT homolog,Protein UXT [Mytilus edulis]